MHAKLESNNESGASPMSLIRMNHMDIYMKALSMKGLGCTFVVLYMKAPLGIHRRSTRSFLHCFKTTIFVDQAWILLNFEELGEGIDF